MSKKQKPEPYYNPYAAMRRPEMDRDYGREWAFEMPDGSLVYERHDQLDRRSHY